tara:strand:- start:1052 stop:1951 length:900 start_codon:yes stop_codon:yes gene_type:complete
MNDFSEGKIGVIGGSGLYSINQLKEVKALKINTPFGNPSDDLLQGKIDGFEVVFLARHGRNHSYLPSEVPYKANIWAMKFLGVKWLISASAVGSLKREIKPLDVVIPTQFIDRTHNRPISFFGKGSVAHISMADPFCARLNEIIYEVALPLMPEGRNLHDGGTYLCMEGPAFSTRAESEFYRSLNCSIIGMTNHTEARLAREAEISYSTIAMSTDYDCWHEDHDNVTVDMIISNLKSNAELAAKIICGSIQKIGKIKPKSIAHDALKYALLTPKEVVPAQTRKDLNILTKKYWGDFNNS